MSILERPTSPEAQAAEKGPPGDRLRVITAGDVGTIDARLGARGFDVVAVAETEDALVHAVSADEPDAIVVEADLRLARAGSRSGTHAVLIAVGDHTPPGAVGRIEPGVSGTVMAGLLHALVADGVGAAAVWGLVPAFAQGAAVQVPQSVLGSLLSAKADPLWTYLVNAVNAFSGHAELVATAGLAVTVSAGDVFTMGGPRTDDVRPSRVLIPPSTVRPTSQRPSIRSSLCHRRHPSPLLVPSGTRPSPATNGGRTGGTPVIMIGTTVWVRTSTTKGRTTTTTW